MTEPDRAAPNGSLALEELQRRPPRVAVSPLPSVFAIAADVAGAGRGVPDEWVQAARAELEPADLAALAPVGARRGFGVPDVVALGNDDGVDVTSKLEWLATLPAETLLDSIAASWCLAPGWEAVARDPSRWLVRYARALGRVWSGIREPWAAASALVDRELERVEEAAARDALPELMMGIHDRAYVRDGLWRLPDPDRLPLELPDEGLTITPILGGPGSGWIVLPEDGLLSAILYPLPGALRLLTGEILPPATALENLLGSQRAGILRLLDEPHRAGRISHALQVAPAGITYHVTALEAAGLVVRERHGRHVVVHRTARGTAVLGLYEPS